MDRLEQMIAEKKNKLAHVNQRVARMEVDGQRSKIKNEFIMKFDTKLT